MHEDKAFWSDTLVHLMALAAKLEGEGQYNNAKLARAAAESMTRQAAYVLSLPSERGQLVGEIQKAVSALTSLGADPGLLDAFRLGIDARAAVPV